MNANPENTKESLIKNAVTKKNWLYVNGGEHNDKVNRHRSGEILEFAMFILNSQRQLS